MKYALDTNVIVSILHYFPKVCQKFDEAVEQGDLIIIPPIVHYEMRRGFLYKSAPKKEIAYQILTNRYSIGKMREEVLERAAKIYADLYRKRFTVGDADILIASFCIINDYTLVTDNTNHFSNIDGLQLMNWNG